MSTTNEWPPDRHAGSIDRFSLVLGIAGLALGHFSYTETKPIIKAGPLQVNSEEQHNISFPTIGSIVLLLVGGGLVIAGRKTT